MYININQKIRIIIIMVYYIIIFGLIGKIFGNNIYNINNMMINGLLIFVWIGLSSILTNKITFNII